MSSTAKKAKKKKAVAAPAISNVDAAAAPAISDADAAAAPAISNVDAADVAEEAKDVPAVQNPENLLAALREEHRQALEKASQQANVFKIKLMETVKQNMALSVSIDQWKQKVEESQERVVALQRSEAAQHQAAADAVAMLTAERLEFSRSAQDIQALEHRMAEQAQHCDKLTELLAVAQKEAAAAARVELSNARADRHDPNLQEASTVSPHLQLSAQLVEAHEENRRLSALLADSTAGKADLKSEMDSIALQLQISTVALNASESSKSELEIKLRAQATALTLKDSESEQARSLASQRGNELHQCSIDLQRVQAEAARLTLALAEASSTASNKISEAEARAREVAADKERLAVQMQALMHEKTVLQQERTSQLAIRETFAKDRENVETELGKHKAMLANCLQMLETLRRDKAALLDALASKERERAKQSEAAEESLRIDREAHAAALRAQSDAASSQAKSTAEALRRLEAELSAERERCKLARAQQEEAEGRARMVSQIMKDLHASRAESEKYKAEAETSVAKLAQETAEVARVLEYVKSLEQKLYFGTAELASNRARLEAFERENAHLRSRSDQHSDLHQEKAMLEAQKGLLTREREVSTRELEAAQRELSGLRSERDSLLAERNFFKKKADSAVLENHRLHRRVEGKGGSAGSSDLEAQISRLTKELDETKKDLERQESAFKTRLSRERAKVLLEIRDSSAESKQLQMFSRSLLGSLTEKDGIIEQLSNTTKHFGKRVFDLENEISELKEELETERAEHERFISMQIASMRLGGSDGPAT